MKRALFLDRDGVINIDKGYVFKKEDIQFYDGIFDLVKEANKNNYLVIVVTNQAGIGRGFYTEKDFLSLSEWIKEQFNKKNSSIDHIYYSPFHPVHGIGKYKLDSELRKPKPGMFFKAKQEYNIDLKNSIMVGDNESDLIAANSAGIQTKISFGNTCNAYDCFYVKDLSEVKKYLNLYKEI